MSSSTLPTADLSSGVFTDTTPRDIAVSVRGLSKSYSIAKNAAKHTTAGEALMHKLRHPFEKVERDTFWALNDVSFDIQKGDVVGIIGRNGAGKSTLLKILSRITEPTQGRIDLYGRVGSLLEVGTGFHPELTGRENIFLNGTILGMKKSEIARQFDAIVDFAGVEQFLDTPVKRYSSGMYVRLAFAVAAHLNPEILIVDEVLAVGDAEFQKKCLGKMQDVAASGRTVMFVSHNMTNIMQLCNNGILLHSGKIIAYGPVEKTATKYMDFGLEQNAEAVWKIEEAPGNEIAKVHSLRILDPKSHVCGDHLISNSIIIEMEFSCEEAGTRLNPSYHVMNMFGDCVFATSNIHDPEWGKKLLSQGTYRSRCIIPAHLLNDGQYRISAFVVKDAHTVVASAEGCASFSVLDDGMARGDYTGTWIGQIRPLLSWDVTLL